MMENILLDSVTFSYGKKETIRRFSLSFGKGEFCALIGPNGAGKSTILKLCSGILKPQSGKIKLFNKDLEGYPSKERAGLVSYLPQLLDTNVSFKVMELAEMGLYPGGGGLSPDEAIGVAGLKEKAQSSITELSAGEKRRAFFAMLLVQGAKTLLLDEPLSHLDIKYQVELVKLLKDIIEKSGITVVMAVHDINTVFQFQKVCVIKDGMLFAAGSPGEIITKELIREVFEVEAENLLPQRIL